MLTPSLLSLRSAAAEATTRAGYHTAADEFGDDARSIYDGCRRAESWWDALTCEAIDAIDALRSAACDELVAAGAF